jgi:hypothetical protein
VPSGDEKHALLSSVTFYRCGRRNAELGASLRAAAPRFHGGVLAVGIDNDDMTATIRFDVDTNDEARE